MLLIQVSAWGLILLASNPETKLYWSDDLFVKVLIKIFVV